MRYVVAQFLVLLFLLVFLILIREVIPSGTLLRTIGAALLFCKVWSIVGPLIAAYLAVRARGRDKVLTVAVCVVTGYCMNVAAWLVVVLAGILSMAGMGVP